MEEFIKEWLHGRRPVSGRRTTIQMAYPYLEFLPELEVFNVQLETAIGFKPNNCLINYYLDGRSKMGWHSDQTDILEGATGIAIVSIQQHWQHAIPRSDTEQGRISLTFRRMK